MSRNETLNVKVPSVMEMSKDESVEVEQTSSNKSVLGGVVATVVVTGSNAVASGFTAPTLSITEPTDVAIAVIAGLGGLWGLLKAIGVMKRG